MHIRSVIILMLALVGLSMSSEAAPKPAKIKPIIFTAMGCGPYNADAEVALTRFIRVENQVGTSAFMVHCGDIVTGKIKNWPESQYAKVAGILRDGNRIPTFVVPGDNEWNDLDDPARGWRFWTKHFLKFDEQWKFPEPVKRQPERTENFAFVNNHVVFIGINKVGGRIHDKDEWNARHADNARWIDANLQASKTRVHSAVIFAQATAAGRQTTMVAPFKQAAERFGKPILYLHADGHKWFVIEKEWATNITHVQMDLISSNFPPLQVTVTGDPKTPFKFDRRQNSPVWGTVKKLP